ncbi:hypothetical protein BGZ81_001712, partial [Podila clonocystis]
MVADEIEKLGQTGIRALTVSRMEEEYRDPEQVWDFQAICNQTLNGVHNEWDYATSRLFIALPSDLDLWIDSQPLTHKFRLYFLCDMKKQFQLRERTPPHVHISNHAGYSLIHPQLFFQEYGDYVLRVLRMVKIGFSNKFYEIPPLGSFKILWKCDTNVTGSQLSKGNIGPLIDKAIEYLDAMRFPRWTKTPDLTHASSAVIHAYLDVQDGNSALGNLHCYIDPLQKMTWVCQTHAQQHYLDQECLERLQEFVSLHGGYVDMQQAMISVELGSTTEADLFLVLLATTKHTFNISIKLSWRPEQKYMDELCLKISWTGTVVLEFDGIGPNVCFTRQRSKFFQSKSANIRLVMFLNYPEPYEQRLFMDSCEVQLSSSPPRSSYNWVEVQRAVVEFAESIYKRKATTKVTTKECTLAIEEVQSRLASHGLSEASTITIYDSGWEGVLCLLEGAFVEMNTFSMDFPMALVASGRLRKMTTQLLDADADQTLYYMAHGHDVLKELNISVKGRNALDQIEHLANLWHYTCISRRHTLLETTDGFDRTVVAEFVI